MCSERILAKEGSKASMVKDLEYPEPGEHLAPPDLLGEGGPAAAPRPPLAARRVGFRRRSQEMPAVRVGRACANDPCRRTSEDLRPIALSAESAPAEPRNDASAEHSAPISPSDAVPDDAPLSER